MNTKPVPITLPEILRERAANLGANALECLTGMGNAALLDEPLLAVIASRACPGNVLSKTVEQVPEWVKAGYVIISGFHSPLEQQVLHSVLRRCGRAVKVLARGMTDLFRPTQEERKALVTGNMLIITALPLAACRITRAAALGRNRLVFAIAEERCVPYIEEGSPLQELVI
ncbi:hypothetical protein FACS1894187_25340 [Synergistales bacterium]|nr:hypothetical protein FACS1894187_25340 [Synergistales bacterium]